MATAGHSGTPLAQKLGIKEGHSVAVLGAPTGFANTLEGLPPDVKVRTTTRGTNNVVVSFHTQRHDLERRVPTLLATLDVDGGLWIAWPKKASQVPTDITDHVVREVFLPLGLVDNKVCAISDVWTGVRVVWRLENRPARRSAR